MLLLIFLWKKIKANPENMLHIMYNADSTYWRDFPVRLMKYLIWVVLAALALLVILYFVDGDNSDNQLNRDFQAGLGIDEKEASKLVEVVHYIQSEANVERDAAYKAAEETGRNFKDENVDLKEVGKNTALIADVSGVSEGMISKTVKTMDRFRDINNTKQAFDILTAAYQNLDKEAFKYSFTAYGKYSPNIAKVGLTSEDFYKLMIDAGDKTEMDAIGDGLAHNLITGILSDSEEQMKALEKMSSKNQAKKWQKDIMNGGEKGRDAVIKIFEKMNGEEKDY